MIFLWKSFLFVCLTTAAFAREGAETLEGEDPTGAAIVGALVQLRSTNTPYRASTETGPSGGFRLDGLNAGRYILVADAAGFRKTEISVVLPFAESLPVRLDLATFVQEVTVSAMMPELVREVEIEGRRLEEQVAQDTGEFLREQPEMFSVRRGAINLDPTLRGLQESQIAMFVDGTRTFAAGPARMDSDISHLSPHAVQSIRVVKGPYALAWGAGAMSAVQLETVRPNFHTGGFDAGGRLGYNYGENGDTSDGYVTAWGSDERFRFTAAHNTRVGYDYQDGNGDSVPAGYESYDTRWDVGFLLNPEMTIEYSGGYQEQRDMDFPGRILDATFFKTGSHALELDWDRTGWGQLYVQFYANLKEHLMNNAEKPTGRPMPGRIPPFGLDIALPAESDTVGGRAFMVRELGGELSLAPRQDRRRRWLRSAHLLERSSSDRRYGAGGRRGLVCRRGVRVLCRQHRRRARQE